MKYAYPVILETQPDGYVVAKAPDLPGVVCGGDTLPDALLAVAAGCEMWLTDAERSGEAIPNPSAMSAVPVSGDQQVSMIVADTDAYRRANDTRAVKKTVSVPAWMADQAERNGISLSQALQETLRTRLVQ